MVFNSLSGDCQSTTPAKPRAIVTTDGEIDDVGSFIRLLLYANEFDLEGLIYSSSMWHYRGDGKGTKIISEMEMTRKMYGERTDLRWTGTHWMEDLIEAYEKVYPKLSTHAKDFPTALKLRSIIKVGNIDFEGEMDHDTEGSDFIKEKLLDGNHTPIYLQVWGGTNTIARALLSIENQYKNTPDWQNVYKKVCDKVIIYAILDQDATYRKYISVNWKGIKVYYNSHQFWCLAYPWKSAVNEKLHPLLQGKFMGEEIINNHGALTKMYYSYGDGQKQAGDNEHIHGDLSKIKSGQWGSFGQYDFISEGDSPAFLHLIDVGLDNLKNPDYGGWGGRLKQSKTIPTRWEDGEEVADFNPISQKIDQAYPQIRWLEALQNDFAARADWCVKEYAEANHAPKISVKDKQLKAKAGQVISFTALATDPDNNKVNISFWQYQEAGTSPEKVILNATGNTVQVQIPLNGKRDETIHIIVEGKDNGTPPLTRYQRVVLTIE